MSWACFCTSGPVATTQVPSVGILDGFAASWTKERGSASSGILLTHSLCVNDKTKDNPFGVTRHRKAGPCCFQPAYFVDLHLPLDWVRGRKTAIWLNMTTTINSKNGKTSKPTKRVKRKPCPSQPSRIGFKPPGLFLRQLSARVAHSACLEPQRIPCSAFDLQEKWSKAERGRFIGGLGGCALIVIPSKLT